MNPIEPRNVGAKRQQTQRLLRTAYHEAGHVVFYRRHGHFVLELAVSEGYGEARGGTEWVCLPDLAEHALRSGGGQWHKWRVGAFCYAAECIAGPFAEHRFLQKQMPAVMPRHGPHANDWLQASQIIDCWCRLAGHRRIRKYRAILLKRIESYVRRSLATTRVWTAIKQVSKLLAASDDPTKAVSFANSLKIPKARIPQSFLELV